MCALAEKLDARGVVEQGLEQMVQIIQQHTTTQVIVVPGYGDKTGHAWHDVVGGLASSQEMDGRITAVEDLASDMAAELSSFMSRHLMKSWSPRTRDRVCSCRRRSSRQPAWLVGMAWHLWLSS
jgi:hypothetical protein